MRIAWKLAKNCSFVAQFEDQRTSYDLFGNPFAKSLRTANVLKIALNHLKVTDKIDKLGTWSSKQIAIFLLRKNQSHKLVKRVRFPDLFVVVRVCLIHLHCHKEWDPIWTRSYKSLILNITRVGSFKFAFVQLSSWSADA